ncbi:hypothetical protein BH24ACT26_BH24ACT26_05010 [soil metagenome]
MASRSIQLPGIAPAGTTPWRPIAAASAVAIAAGLAAAIYPMGAFLLAGVVLVAAFALRDTAAMERGMMVLLLGGAVMLGYGFANLGIRTGAIPLPATELLFLPLAAFALADRRTRLDPRVLLPLSLYATLVAIRLVFDFPVWGVFAVRDTTAALEAFILVVGYRAIARDGVGPWIRRLGYIFGAVLLWGATYPWAKQIEALGPTVGLQRATPLLDQRGVKFTVVAAGLYFLVFTTGWKRMVALGLVAGLIGIFQARTLYILFPLTILLLGWALHQFGRIALQLVPVVLIGAGLIVFAGSLDVEGRRGEVNFQFISAHALTLTGQEGPKSGTIRGRVEWFERTMDFVTSSPGYVAVGVGLGPDLTFGMLEGDEGQAVRKPHDDYLEVFARTGLLGFTLFIWMLLACLIPIARKARSGTGTEERFCAFVLAASFVYLGVAGAQPLLSFSYGSVPLFSLLGMGVAASRPGHGVRRALPSAPPAPRR